MGLDLDIRELIEQVRRCADALERLVELKDPPPKPEPRMPRTPEAVMVAVRNLLKTALDTRQKNDVLGRRVAIYVMRDELELSWPRIAANVGLEDHSSAIYHFKVGKRLYEVDMRFRSLVEQVRNRLDKRPA